MFAATRLSLGITTSRATVLNRSVSTTLKLSTYISSKSTSQVNHTGSTANPTSASAHDMTVTHWSPNFAVEKNLNRFATLPEKFMAKFTKLSPNLKKQFELTETPALMFRRSTAELIDLVSNEGIKEVCSTAVIVDGNRGTGKSSALIQTASYFHSKDWIIIPVLRLSEWTSGIEPYEISASNDTYYQPALTTKFLQLLLDWNEKALSKILVADESNKSVADLARSAISMDAVSSFAALEMVIKSIFTEKNRKPVLIAMDQINALYRKTAYFDKTSQPLNADKFAMAALIQKIFSELGQKNTVVLAAVDYTESLVGSHYLKHLLKKIEPVNKTAEVPLVQPIDVDLEARDEFGVILPLSLNPTHSDEFSKHFKLHPKHLTKFEMPVYSLSEISDVLDFYHSHNVYHGILTETEAARRWMLTQGNPTELLKSCTTL
ncbi:hypothetical protein BATDEDRAFT_92522 [Batrachochytrium dendrobatidis JAM81]|uniref:Small ribosomal subunit protein mS29 n=2 Tax=Batrachochytrium dendrobatidis TaxID=109871 RepID=F4PDU6_BATDJ|nr:uncharacterized protein BATDEDRAFT_92522 [Batrachochytrium dendrobatidis JAM81]EGF76458.1 hypothetical protein BATDEDRAFT_92522 [Batrachochytrium dendrobatidis JAM81]OAJ39145.1 hypothetical protein BDEG_23014 [Batrachochytrium dendrobatidis JEL423]|eukprot:XP_006682877.1 hypothetical protein BATDEDRAFT_92522 [Batrachochytrium dendrobatidis JAM81]